jgi:hypothetical protein
MSELWFLGFIYGFMGLGVWSSSKYKGDGKETPFIAVVCIIFWPVLLLMYSVMFIFTGRKICDE